MPEGPARTELSRSPAHRFGVRWLAIAFGQAACCRRLLRWVAAGGSKLPDQKREQVSRGVKSGFEERRQVWASVPLPRRMRFGDLQPADPLGRYLVGRVSHQLLAVPSL